MNAVQQAVSYRGILSALNVSKSDRQFLDAMVVSCPAVLNGFGRRKSKVVKTMQLEIDLHYTEIQATIERMITEGLIYASKNGQTIGLLPVRTATTQPRKRKSGRCAYCQSMATNATIDHIWPKGQGGPDTPENVVLACRACNESKANRTPQQWAADILRYNKPIKPKPIRLMDHVRLATVLLVSFVTGWIKS